MDSTITAVQHVRMHFFIVTFSLLIREKCVSFKSLWLFLLQRVLFISVRNKQLTLQWNLWREEMWERPNCCYIGPSTGAADLFLAGNYISSDCRHCEGNHQGCCAAVFIQPLTFHWRKLKREEAASFHIYCMCVCVWAVCPRSADRKDTIILFIYFLW